MIPRTREKLTDRGHSLSGPGTIAMRLGPHFDHIIVSDAGQANIASAKSNLASPYASKFTFIHSPAEASASAIAPSSVDFVSVGMAFHYFDAHKAVRAIATMLKPGGTLAAVTYGFRLRFPGRPDLEELWHRAASDGALRLIREGKLFPAAVKGLAAAMAGFDAVPLPADLFEPGAQRITVNTDEGDVRPLHFVEDDPCWTPAPDRTGPADVRRVMVDRSWRRDADTEWLRGFLASSQMGYGEQTWATGAWQLLERRVHEAGGQVTVEWPVAMILATRNSRPVV